MLIGGCVKDKAALGRRQTDGTADIRCLLCCPAEVDKARRPAVDEPVHIMRDCTALKRLRDWVRKLRPKPKQFVLGGRGALGLIPDVSWGGR